MRANFKVSYTLKKNVEIGASIMIGDQIEISIQKELKSSTKLLGKLKEKTVFMFRTKDEVNSCKENSFQPFKLKVKNSVTSEMVKHCDSKKNINFLFTRKANVENCFC